MSPVLISPDTVETNSPAYKGRLLGKLIGSIRLQLTFQDQHSRSRGHAELFLSNSRQNTYETASVCIALFCKQLNTDSHLCVIGNPRKSGTEWSTLVQTLEFMEAHGTCTKESTYNRWRKVFHGDSILHPLCFHSFHGRVWMHKDRLQSFQEIDSRFRADRRKLFFTQYVTNTRNLLL